MMSILMSPPTITGNATLKSKAGPAVWNKNAMLYSPEINRLLTAAVVSRRFCRLLLADPVAAAAKGYNGETFLLTPEEIQQIRAIKATSLRDFAGQLVDGHRYNTGSSLLDEQPTIQPRDPVTQDAYCESWTVARLPATNHQSAYLD